MDTLAGLRLKLLSLSVYRALLRDPVVSALKELLFSPADHAEAAVAAYAALFHQCAGLGCTESTAAHMEKALLCDDNPFTRHLAAGTEPPKFLTDAAMADISAIRSLAGLDSGRLFDLFPALRESGVTLPDFAAGDSLPVFDRPAGLLLPALKDYHRKNGCGQYVSYPAFRWDGGVLPIPHTDPITLSDLKGYEPQRKQVLDNTESFLLGYNASNMLLYGDRGTGKSSTVHALLNAYRDKGLRMVELPRDRLRELPALSEELAAVPLKFILFIDDLSFSQGDDSFGALKAVLEGSLAARPENLLIYATSNRRHLVRESHSDRAGDEVHAADTMQELLALSDRFGITVTFLNPNRSEYLDIVARLAGDRKLNLPVEPLFAAAERWALSRGGRSPRVARQFVDFAESRLLRDLSID